MRQTERRHAAQIDVIVLKQSSTHEQFTRALDVQSLQIFRLFQHRHELTDGDIARPYREAFYILAMRLPEFRAFVELNFTELQVAEGSEAVMKIPCWWQLIAKSRLVERQLMIVDEFVVLTSDLESTTAETRLETIGRMKGLEDFDEDLRKT